MKNFVEAKTVKSWISDEKELAFIDVRETAQHTAGHPLFSILSSDFVSPNSPFI